MALIVLLGLAQAADSTSSTDAHRIQRLMKTQFDRPGQPLSVDPVVIEGHFAIAGWIQGEAGGRALLQRAGKQWEIVLCSGDGLLQPATLAGTGMSDEAARSLIARTRERESRLSPAQRARLSSFAGLVRIRAGGHHGTQAGHDDAAPAASAHGIQVTNAWARATPPRMRLVAVNLLIANAGKQADVLLGAWSPIATRIQLHRTILDAGVARMRPVSQIPIEPGAEVALEPIGLHLMLVGLASPLTAGTSFPMTLNFRTAGAITILVAVRPLTDAPEHTRH